MNGLNTFRGICIRDEYDPSNMLTFTSQYYANETDLYTSAPHQVKDAFGWADDYYDIRSVAVHGTLCDGSTEDNVDYSWLMALPNLKHIDLSGVTDRIMPDKALSSEKLLSAVMPQAMNSVGEFVFGENNTSLCAIDIPANYVAPAMLLNGVKNPNLLCYVKEKRYANPLRGVLRNVIYGESLQADTITLSHGSPIFIPKGFTAREISYTRDFSKETNVNPGGFGSGWETMSVPFDVNIIKNGSKLLEPFAFENRTGMPFWLFEPDGNSFQKASRIGANIPYLIAMPNNPWYMDEYNVSGSVVFAGSNVVVPVSSDDDVMTGIGNGNYIHVNYANVKANDKVFALNEENEFWNNTDYRPGGLFVRGKRDVPAFECYVTSDSGARYVRIFGNTDDVEQVFGFGLHVSVENGNLCLRSDIAMKVPVYDTVGRLIRVINIPEGEAIRISDLAPGIYIINGKKIIL
ncbi:MAG: T9SS type A sorting domain-containing protein [Muribaculum sp.]|nr:T9SS type A sorting domain-containing protein [Muribaculum sp.]